jgi:alpha/beta superfamily hydrolase
MVSMAEAVSITAADGVVLEGEHARPPAGTPVRAGMVLCHPHPQFGGTMRSIVISALFESMPAIGVECLRFNFRGVEGSGGTYSEGDRERLDAQAAIALLAAGLPEGAPLVLAGWSFGADVALSCSDEAIAAWLAIACPLRFVHDLARVSDDPRPKQVVLAQHDEFRSPEDVGPEIEQWRNARVDVVGGASHFFVGRTDRVVAHAAAFVDSLAG